MLRIVVNARFVGGDTRKNSIQFVPIVEVMMGFGGIRTENFIVIIVVMDMTGSVLIAESRYMIMIFADIAVGTAANVLNVVRSCLAVDSAQIADGDLFIIFARIAEVREYIIMIRDTMYAPIAVGLMYS